MRDLYGSGQEVEVKRATHDGWVWVKGRVVEDMGEAVRCFVYNGWVGTTSFSPDSVRKPGEDKA